jgi:hypothetical protein
VATCVELGPGNELIATATPPESCTAFIIQSQTDWLANQSPLWMLTPEQGAEIAGTMLMVLAIAYVFRLLIRATDIDETSQSEKE